MRQNDLEIWQLNDQRTFKARDYCRSHDDPKDFIGKCKERSDETVANIMITQLRQIDAMLADVLRKKEQEFLESGGVKEAMFKARKNRRGD